MLQEGISPPNGLHQMLAQDGLGTLSKIFSKTPVGQASSEHATRDA
jgi:hypothetical protein